MFERLIVVDCSGHLMGRLASIIAKELLAGQRVVAVRCEELVISGPIWRNQIKMLQKRVKKTNSNHERGPFSIRKPSALLLRMVRGMLPHKTLRGQAAMNRLRAFEGVPSPYDSVQRMVIPEALRALKLRPGRKFTNLGELASKNGWKYAETVKTLEAKRKARGEEYYQRVLEKRRILNQAKEEVVLSDEVKATLEMYGH